MAPPGDAVLGDALRAAEDSLTQARADAWSAFDALAAFDPQRAVDVLLEELERRVDPLVQAVARLGGDPRRCRPERRR